MRVGPAGLLCLAFLLHACAGPTAPVSQADRVARLQARGLRALQAASYRDAFAAFEEALALSEAIDHLPGQMAGLQGLAGVLLELTQWQDAEPLLARAATLAALLGDRAAEAGIRAARGQARLQAGDRAAAEARLTEAREAYTRLGDRTGAARTLTALGVLRREQGDLAGALAAQEDALRTLAAAGPADRATAHLNLGRTLEALGRFPEARAQYEQALALDKVQETPAAIAADLKGLARLAEAEGDLAEALALHRRALAINERTGRADRAVADLAAIAALTRRLGREEEAAAAERRAAELAGGNRVAPAGRRP